MPLDELNNPELPAETSTTDWPPIDRRLLGEARPAPPSFPLHLLPGRWRAWVEAASLPFGSADYLAHGLLGAVSAVCGAGIWAEVAPHWREPLLLWQALVGGPSSGKRASFARVASLLGEIKPWEENSSHGALRVLVDGDLDQADTALYSSVRGVLLWRNDLGDWMEQATRRAERPAWLAAWNAGPAMIGRSPQAIFAVGLLGALAPEQLAPPLSRSFVEGDSGLAARFLYVWPEGRSAAPSLARAEADDAGLVALLQRIANFAGHRETPGVVPLDAAAAARVEELITELRDLAEETDGAGEGAGDGVEAEWIAKGVSTIVRLAGLLSLMQWADDLEAGTSQAEWLPIGRAHVESAYSLWSTYYLPHARAVFDRAGVAGCERAARRVARWLRRVRSAEISREDIRRQALCQTVNAEGAEDVLARLEAAGVLREVVHGHDGAGRPRRRWKVNPALR